jgi:flavorubredoxin
MKVDSWETYDIMLRDKGGDIMKILVLYYSNGGNTKRLAEQIAKGVESVNGVDRRPHVCHRSLWHILCGKAG